MAKALTPTLAQINTGRARFEQGDRPWRTGWSEWHVRFEDGSKVPMKYLYGLAMNIEPKTYSTDSIKAALHPLGLDIANTVRAGDPQVAAPGSKIVKLAHSLNIGEVYTRAELKAEFGIHDATINNGIFKPMGHRSVWLFVTKDKTSDRTQYHDALEGDVLTMQGQTAGRTDDLIVQHRERGDELLLFYRDSKLQYPRAGFRYEGPFRYESHSGAKPTTFKLLRPVVDSVATELKSAQQEAEEAGAFDASNVEDARKRMLAGIVCRQGQPAFRKAVIDAYGGICAITGCALIPILEAAHVHPYRGDHTNVVSNGILLRSDIHTLFDLRLLAIDPRKLAVLVSPELDGTEYEKFRGRELRKVRKGAQGISVEALSWHRSECVW